MTDEEKATRTKQAAGQPLYSQRLVGVADESSGKCYVAPSYIVDKNGERCAGKGLMLEKNETLELGEAAAFVRGQYVPSSLKETHKEIIEKASVTARIFDAEDVINDAGAVIVIDPLCIASYVDGEQSSIRKQCEGEESARNG